MAAKKAKRIDTEVEIKLPTNHQEQQQFLFFLCTVSYRANCTF